MAKKLFTIHAGTHKTASTYIQSRLYKNKEILQRHNIRLLTPENSRTGLYKEFASWVKFKNYPAIEQDLKRIEHDDSHVIISAEHFTQSIIDISCINDFKEILNRKGYELQVIIFLRDQPDYINSIYVQEVRRLYHTRNVPGFERRCRENRSHWFDYYSMFSHLINEKTIKTKFLPYCSSFGDPFLRFIYSLDLDLPYNIEWEQASIFNDQPGIKGVWLALQAGREIQRLGVNLRRLDKISDFNRSNFIRKYSVPRGWSQDRFYGLKPHKAKRIKNFYKKNNDIFAKKVWGRDSWSDVYKNLKVQEFNILDESLLSKNEMDEMKGLVEKVVSDIQQAYPAAFTDN